MKQDAHVIRGHETGRPWNMTSECERYLWKLTLEAQKYAKFTFEATDHFHRTVYFSWHFLFQGFSFFICLDRQVGTLLLAEYGQSNFDKTVYFCMAALFHRMVTDRPFLIAYLLQPLLNVHFTLETSGSWIFLVHYRSNVAPPIDSDKGTDHNSLIGIEFKNLTFYFRRGWQLCRLGCLCRKVI